MRQFLGLTRRNLLVYFKDVQAVIFSMLTSIIVFMLYLLFLRQSYVDSIHEQAKMLGDLVKETDIKVFTAGLLLSGLMGSTVITVSYHTLTTLVHDREKRIDYDISATPIRRWQIILSYFLASFLAAILMTWFILTAGLILVAFEEGSLHLTAGIILRMYGLTVLGALSATALFMPLVLLFKSTSASGAFFGILSAASGFVIGAYIPIAQFSDTVQSFCSVFPGTGVTTLFRTTLLGPILDHMDKGIGGVDGGMFVQGMREAFAPPVKIFGATLNEEQTVAYIVVLAVLCVAAICLIYPKIYRRK